MDKAEVAFWKEFADVIADEVIQKANQEPPRHPDLNAIRWMALGMAVADKRFRDKLFTDVGERAFGNDEIAANLVKSMDGNGTMRQFALLLEHTGFIAREGEYLSEAVLRILSGEDEEAWNARDDRLQQLIRSISDDMAKLKTIIRTRPALQPPQLPPEQEE